MANKTKAAVKKAAPGAETPEPESAESSMLKTAAEAIGTAIGTIAAKTGIAAPAPSAKSARKGKLPKKDKKRLPRKEKKKLAKARRGGAVGV
jgi:hypothetical protein